MMRGDWKQEGNSVKITVQFVQPTFTWLIDANITRAGDSIVGQTRTTNSTNISRIELRRIH